MTNIVTEARVKMGGLDEFIKMCVDRLENEKNELARLERGVDQQKENIKETEAKMELAQFEYDAIKEKLERDGDFVVIDEATFSKARDNNFGMGKGIKKGPLKTIISKVGEGKSIFKGDEENDR